MSGHRYVNGDIFLLWGKPYTLRVYATGGRSVRVVNDELHLSCPIGSDAAARQKILERFFRQTLERAIPLEAARCEEIVGRHANEWHVKAMRTRWGTCNIEDKRIWLALDLVHYEPVCLRYVITHELVHLYERLHNDRFYTYMDMFMPEWKAVKKALNDAALAAGKSTGDEENDIA